MEESTENVFESFVNSERCKTASPVIVFITVFESFVNSERCKTHSKARLRNHPFESFVNSERCKTGSLFFISTHLSLRALLIQKDVKQHNRHAER